MVRVHPSQLGVAIALLTSCRICGKICYGGLCPPHKAQRDAARERRRSRPSPGKRGYGTAYRTARRELAKWLMAQWQRGNPVKCVICGQTIPKPTEWVEAGKPDIPCQSWTAEHIVPLSRGGDPGKPYLGPAHPACNYARRNTRP